MAVEGVSLYAIYIHMKYTFLFLPAKYNFLNDQFFCFIYSCKLFKVNKILYGKLSSGIELKVAAISYKLFTGQSTETL